MCASHNASAGISTHNTTGMFFRASSFNQPIGAWAVSKATDMVRMLGLHTPHPNITYPYLALHHLQVSMLDLTAFDDCNKLAVHMSFEAQVPAVWSYNWSDVASGCPWPPPLPPAYPPRPPPPSPHAPDGAAPGMRSDWPPPTAPPLPSASSSSTATPPPAWAPWALAALGVVVLLSGSGCLYYRRAARRAMKRAANLVASRERAQLDLRLLEHQVHVQVRGMTMHQEPREEGDTDGASPPPGPPSDPLSASGSGEAPATGSPVPQPVPHAEEAPEEAPSPLGRPGGLQTAPELELEAMTTSRDWQQQADADLRA